MSTELNSLRRRFGQLLIILLWAHVPVVIVAALMNRQPWDGLGLASAALAGLYHLCYAQKGGVLLTRYVSGLALMGQVALLVYALRGHPWQMDMHMYFFASLALMIAWFDRRAILFAATAVALHHLLLVYLLPYAVFPEGADLPRVFLHAAIVAFQAFVLVWLSNVVEVKFHRNHVMSQDLRSSNIALEQRTKEAEEATAAKSLFLANMSHEIRTPLNAVLGFCHLLQRTEMTVKQEDYVTKISSSGTTLLRLINDILDFSKNEAGKLDLEMRPFNVHAVIEQQLQMVLTDARAKGIELEVQRDESIPNQLVSDEMRFGQVILNLVNNAVKFTESGTVTVRTELLEETESTTTIAVSVIDTGIGMSEQQKARLFSTFTQADNTMTRRFGGTGLGLAISRQIVRLMGGDITVESQEWVGTTFRFTITLSRVGAGSLDLSQPDPALRRLRIMAVDDNPASRQILSEIFLGWDMRIEVSPSAGAAISKLQSAAARGLPYDVLLLDWKMPGLDGLEAARMIAQDAKIHPKPKMLIVTAYGSDVFVEAVDSTIVAGYLAKPVQPKALLETLSELFSVMVHSSEDNAAPRTISPPPAHELPQVSPAYQGLRVLLVEDNEINREIACELLTDAGLSVDTAENGLIACEQVAKIGDSYAAILMDVQMPIMDGLEATRRIRRDWTSERLPIIAMTAHAYATERQRCLDAGMNDHIAKPVDPMILVRTLDHWLGTAAPNKEKAIRKLEEEVATLPHVLLPDVLPDHLPPFNISRALERVNSKRALLRRLIISFAESQGQIVEEIRQAISQGRLEEARRMSHTLKGLAGSLELPALQAAAMTLERQLQAEGVQDYEQDLEAVQQALHPALAAAQSLTQKAGSVAVPQAPESAEPQASPEEIAALRDALRQQLTKRSLSARSGFNKLATAMGLSDEARSNHPLHHALERLDYQAALNALERTENKTENISV